MIHLPNRRLKTVESLRVQADVLHTYAKTCHCKGVGEVLDGPPPPSPPPRPHYSPRLTEPYDLYNIHICIAQNAAPLIFKNLHVFRTFLPPSLFFKVSGQTQGAFHTNFSRWSQQWPLFDQKHMNLICFRFSKIVLASKILETC